MRTLDEIAISTGTDKNSMCHAYTQYYSMFFESLRDKPIKLLELGVYHGDSLRMWAEYFPQGLIYGADIEDMSRYDGPRIQTYLVDELSIESLQDFAEPMPNFDIIVNDASHQSEGMTKSLLVLWAKLNHGGYFVVEDILCSYFDQWVKTYAPMKETIKDLIDDVNMGGKVDQNNLCSNKAVERNKYTLTAFEHDIEWVFNSCGLVIIKKL